MGADELARDSQQAIKWQQQGTSQVDHHSLLRRREHGLQKMGRLRSPKTARFFHLETICSVMPKGWARTVALQNNSGHQQWRAFRVYAIIRDATDTQHRPGCKWEPSALGARNPGG